jgi:RNA polymerase sigma factor for flagellar operon FliA
VEKAEPEDKELLYTKTGLILSLSKVILEGDDSISFIDTLVSNSKTPEEEYALKEMIERISYVIENYLDENERKVIHYLYFEEREPKEIQEMLGISLGRISQIKLKALDKIKKMYMLVNYLPIN